MPANVGASKLVPPATVSSELLVSRKPCAQLPVIMVDGSLEQYRNPALFGDAVNEISGNRRKLPEGMPGTPVCQLGRAVNMLTPPPPDERLPATPPAGAASSFQAISGIYESAELMASVVEFGAACQKAVFPIATSAARNSEPPIAVTYWLLEGKSTANASCAAVDWFVLPEQSVEPSSPSAVKMVCPCVAACASVAFRLLYAVWPSSDSQAP